MPYKNYIYEYYQKICSGKITVGKWIKAIFKIIIDSLEKQDYYFSAKEANRAIKFIENFCHHSQGRSDLLKMCIRDRFILADFASIVEHPLYQNEIAITGEIMNIPAMRETPRGKKITDLMVRVDNELDGGGAYIPCICWQAAAEEMAKYSRGTVVKLKGRLQSREYIKRRYTGSDSETEEVKISREVSAEQIEVWWQPERA